MMIDKSMDITCGKHYDDGEYCRFAFQAICEYCRPGKLCLYCNCCGGSGRHPLFLCGTICKNGISFFQGGKESIERKDIQDTSSPGKLI